jgi:hypothetical protein
MSWYKGLICGVVVVFGLGLAVASADPPQCGGRVLPPSARPHGYSLTEMAEEVALMSSYGNDLAFYPDTPFQVLYRQGNLQDPEGTNTFYVKPGTFLYFKGFFIDNAPPPIGDFPVNGRDADDYILSLDRIGLISEIEVDGKVTSLDHRGYISGPLAIPGLNGGATETVQTGAFLTPLSKGTHKIVSRAILAGDDILPYLPGGEPFVITITYTVVVE